MKNTNITTEQLLSVEVALGIGVPIEFNGQTVELKPASLDMFGKVVRYHKMEALRVYEEYADSAKIPEMRRLVRMNAILNRAGNPDDFDWSDPYKLCTRVWLGIKESLPDVKREEVEAWFEDEDNRAKITAMPSVREKMTALLALMDFGTPKPQDLLEVPGEKPSDPTRPGILTGTTT